jgi:hypothetical protein
MKLVRIYTDPSGETHFADLGDVPFTPANYAPPAPPLDVAPFAPALQYGFLRLPAGWYGDWHPAPFRQLQIPVSGEVEAQVSDGEVRRFGPGMAVLLEDATGKGHVSRTVGEGDVVIVVVRLPD